MSRFKSKPGAAEESRPRQYRLSALLQAHADDVRSLAAPTSSASRLLSGSRDRTARLWEQEDVREGPTNGWEQQQQWTDEGWVNSLAFLPSRKEDEDQKGYVVLAGADSLIHLFSLAPSAPPAEPTHTLFGHAHNVCAVHCSSDGTRIASASWDMTARVWTWRGGESEAEKGEWVCDRVLVDHGAAVWDVLLLEKEENLVLTACADSRIRLFDGNEVKYSFKGHEGPVRTLAKLLPQDPACALFASGSNDGSIRIWNYQSGDQLTVLGSHDSFVYSLVSLSTCSGGGLASSGEDGIIKIWNQEDGEEDQQILVPALSVWSLAALSNGDLACGCSDNLIWIFSRDEQRYADEETTAVYEAKLAELRSSRAPALPQAEDEAALEADGTKEGEVKLIRAGEQVKAYQWDGSVWKEVGEVVGAEQAPQSRPPPPAKTMFEEQQYDFVFQIDVKDDEPPLPLPYNRDDDPHAVASAFVKQYALPESYLEQIVAFIRSSTA
ncbi:hypothetical protein JCM10213_005624 [Rhodosporidiobolus nylandii]